MNNNSLENEILNLPKGTFININGVSYVKYDNVLDVVNNAYELKNPKIPPKLAERIEELREIGWDDEYIIYDIYTDKETGMMDSNVVRWMNDNKGLFTKALANGYTIEKEPAWVVKYDDMYLMSLAVLYDGDRVNSYFRVLGENFDEPRVFRNKEEAEAARILAARGTVKEWSE
ncbi:hypothetical protein TEHN7126_2232 [Tetragenococcus halophilus subsp. halophilus]|uniref:DUF1642 domain-containing protein n=1 Tax=Tetragenococcus halophilus TaxID=51669 RepID=UPI000CC4D819|nr:DUF1642 domain-containing protein [Tetragenococcus halophilus]GBD74225.1 hypothetical protein TEHN7125_2385 [Tetragenococcus halophilus subsp. halophilus]GBD76533.1 hypothetical protein TEHN7126_2232 [Tetragenococcus halophilus subsp. halophilus]